MIKNVCTYICTIAQWKTHLSKEKEVTTSQVEILVGVAAMFVAKLSSDSDIARASKSLQAEITHIENKGREEEMNKPFVPDEQLIRDILSARKSISQKRNQQVELIAERSLSRTTLVGQVG